MPFTTYTELKAALADWIDRDDLTTQIVDFISLAEAEFNRTLFVPEREGVSTSSVTSGTWALPTDFWALRSLYIDSDPKVFLEQMTLGELRNTYSAAKTGKPQNYAIQKGSELVLGPSPDTTYTLALNYWKSITPLSGSVASNWLLASYPDLYLYGSLVQANMFMIDDARVPLWQQKLGIAFDQAMKAGQDKAYSGSPLRIRAPQVV